MAHGIAGHAYPDRRVLGRDAAPFLPVLSYLYDSGAGAQYPFGLVVQLRRALCPWPGIVHLCHAALTGQWSTTVVRSNSVCDL